MALCVELQFRRSGIELVRFQPLLECMGTGCYMYMYMYMYLSACRTVVLA